MPRIRVALGPRELDLEGSEDFIRSYADSIHDIVECLSADLGKDGDPPPPAVAPPAGPQPDLANREFGEALHLLPESASGTDKILLAGKFVQEASETRTFATREAHQLLMDHGIKLANASASLKQNHTMKRVFRVGGALRVSQNGEEHIASLLEQENGQPK